MSKPITNNDKTSEKNLNNRQFRVKFSNYASAKSFLIHIKKTYANAICSGEVVSFETPSNPIARRNLSIMAYQLGAERVDY